MIELTEKQSCALDAQPLALRQANPTTRSDSSSRSDYDLTRKIVGGGPPTMRRIVRKRS